MNAKAYTVADYGTKLENGSFTGFAGMLQRREVDVIATDLTVTAKVRLLAHHNGLFVNSFSMFEDFLNFRGVKWWSIPFPLTRHPSRS